VGAERTAFYLASVTKCFTATAAMQQVEQGHLELDKEVNEYLRQFRIPSAYPQPVTLARLLTHTAGFDDRNIGYVARDAADVLPMQDYLRLALPPRVMPPGQYISYSNHGYGLAGHLVELASGEEFRQHVQRNILDVLGMAHSTAFTPPPAGVDAATMYFYDRVSDRYEAAAPGHRNIPPAGTVWASGTDMGQFLLAHLQGGTAGTGRILREETMRRMHARQFSQHPALPGFAFGFYERSHGGVRVLEHAGGYIGAATLVALVPEKGLGMFTATNQNTPTPHYAALQALLDGVTGSSERPVSEAAVESPGRSLWAPPYEGSYQSARYSRRSIEKIAILDSQVQVVSGQDGSLVLRPRSGPETRWKEIGPLLFWKVGGQDLIAFGEDSGGSITHLYMSLVGSALPSALEKLSWRDTLPVQLAFLLGAGAVFISSFTLWPLLVVLRRAYRRLRNYPTQPSSRGRLPAALAAFTGMLAVLFFTGLDQLIGNSRYRLGMAYGMPAEMVGLLWLPIVLAVLAVPLACYTAAAWKRGWWGFWTRAYYTLIALAALLLIPFFWNWNLLGFRY